MAATSKADMGTSASSSVDADVAGEKALLPLNFVYAWKLESLFSSSPSGGESWHHSTLFEAGGYRWKLVLHPTCFKAEDGKKYWSLFLRLEDAIVQPSRFVVETTLKSSILNENGNKDNKGKVVYQVRKEKNEEECPFLISLETLKCPSSGFLVVEVINVVVRAEDDGPSFELEEKKTEYTWKIDGFSKLTSRSYKSGPFLLGDSIWNLILYPKGNHQDRFLSLYLELDNVAGLPSSYKVYADFSLIIVNQKYGIDREKRANQHFGSQYSDWGFTSFMPLDDLRDPSKGFLVNDTCKVKVVFHSYK